MADKNHTPPALEEGQDFHVFISHSHKDETMVKEMREELTKYNFKCCNVTEDFLPGSPVEINIEKCIKQSKKVVLIVSEEFMKSHYMHFEVGHALRKEGETKKVTIIPVLLGITISDELPVSIRRLNLLTWGEKDFWPKFLNALSVEELSSLVTAGDIANGLAWSYFYGYLKLVLPGMRERVANCELRSKDELKNLPFLDQMMIIMPNSGFCPNSLKADDENVQHVGFIPFKASRAGNIDRDYKSSVYRVKQPKTGKEVLVIAEFATPLMSMYEMEMGVVAGLPKEEKIVQKINFEHKLAEILEHENNKECHQSYCFMSFEDKRNEKLEPDGWCLSELLADKAFKKLEITQKVLEAKSEQ